MEPNQEFDAWAADEAIPEEPVGNLLSSPSRLHLLLVSQDPRMPGLANMNSLKASASKRPGEPPDASSNKENLPFGIRTKPIRMATRRNLVWLRGTISASGWTRRMPTVKALLNFPPRDGRAANVCIMLHG